MRVNEGAPLVVPVVQCRKRPGPRALSRKTGCVHRTAGGRPVGPGGGRLGLVRAGVAGPAGRRPARPDPGAADRQPVALRQHRRDRAGHRDDERVPARDGAHAAELGRPADRFPERADDRAGEYRQGGGAGGDPADDDPAVPDLHAVHRRRACRARFDQRRARARLVRAAVDEPGHPQPGAGRQARRDDRLHAVRAGGAGGGVLGHAAQRAAGIARGDRGARCAAAGADRLGVPAAGVSRLGDAAADLGGDPQHEGGADLSRAVAAGSRHRRHGAGDGAGQRAAAARRDPDLRPDLADGPGGARRGGQRGVHRHHRGRDAGRDRAAALSRLPSLRARRDPAAAVIRRRRGSSVRSSRQARPAAIASTPIAASGKTGTCHCSASVRPSSSTR